MTDLIHRAETASPDEQAHILALAWAEMDDWCAKQCAELAENMGDWVMDGGDIYDPIYRTQLGRSQAFHRMRSYISGARSAAHRAAAMDSLISGDADLMGGCVMVNRYPVEQFSKWQQYPWKRGSVSWLNSRQCYQPLMQCLLSMSFRASI